MTTETKRDQLRVIVRGAYDLQKLRIQMGNRVVGNFKAKLGQQPGQSEDALDNDAKVVLTELRESFRKMMDGVTLFPRQGSFKGDEVISTFTELCLVSNYLEIERNEVEQFNRLKSILRDFPIYTEFLKDVRGCGHMMAGVIISEIDISQAEYASSLWKYAGLDVASDGAGRSRKSDHLVDREYTNSSGELATRKSITFNPWLKTKLIGVLGSSFVKCGGEYREVYDNYKHRIEHMPAHVEKTKGHRHAMAVRYAVKRFLADLYAEWRALEGLPVALEYSEAKLGIVHKKAG